jgi:hypothetical protein
VFGSFVHRRGEYCDLVDLGQSRHRPRLERFIGVELRSCCRAFKPALQDRGKEIVFAREVLVHGIAGDAGRARDRRHGGRVVAVAQQQFVGRVYRLRP